MDDHTKTIWDLCDQEIEERRVAQDHTTRAPQSLREKWIAASIATLSRDDTDEGTDGEGQPAGPVFRKPDIWAGRLLAETLRVKGGLTDTAWRAAGLLLKKYESQIGTAPPMGEEEKRGKI